MTTTDYILPRKPSELIRLAVRDARTLYETQREEYQPSSTSWHAGEEDLPCQICVAGAVIAGTLGANKNQYVEPSDFYHEVEDRLSALDAFRRGHHVSAIKYLDYPASEAVLRATKTAPQPRHLHYRTWDDFLLHLTSLEKIAAHYEAHGM